MSMYSTMSIVQRQRSTASSQLVGRWFATASIGKSIANTFFMKYRHWYWLYFYKVLLTSHYNNSLWYKIVAVMWLVWRCTKNVISNHCSCLSTYAFEVSHLSGFILTVIFISCSTTGGVATGDSDLQGRCFFRFEMSINPCKVWLV